MINWLPFQQSEINDDDLVYSLEEIKKTFEVIDICKDGCLVLKWDNNKLWLNFALL